MRKSYAFLLWKKRTWYQLPRKSKKFVIASFACGFLVHGFYLLIKDLKNREAQVEAKSKDRIYSVGVDTAVVQGIKNIFSTQAYLQSWKEVVIRPGQTATVRKLSVEVGQHVKSGETLALLSSELLQLKSELDKIDLQLRNMDFAVTMALARKNFVSEKEFKQRKLEYRAQEIRTRIAKLENTDLLESPIDGLVSEINMKNGDYIDNSNQYFIKVADVSELKISIYIPQKIATRLKKGDEVELVRSEIDEAGSKIIQSSKATIQAVAPIVDPKTGSILVEINAKNTPKSWVPGMYVEVSMTIDQSPTALVVPQQAVVFENKVSFVYRILSNEKAGERVPASDLAKESSDSAKSSEQNADSEVQRVQKVPVKLGLKDAKSIEIIGGLEQFDLVVVTGQGALADGSKVEIVQ